MKNLSPELKSHIESEVTTLVTCWRISLADNTTIALTDHTANVTYNEITYIASTSFIASANESNSSLSVDNIEIESILNSDSISQQDIINGKYDNAQVEIFVLNYNNTSQGIIQLRVGTIGRIIIKNDTFVAEIRGLKDKMLQNIGEIYSPLCRANFCDKRCKLNKSNFTTTHSVSSVLSRSKFIDDSIMNNDGSYDYGMITFISGKNESISRSIRHHIGQTLITTTPFPHEIQIGDNYTLLEGCNKMFDTCSKRFQNAFNFRGEPNIPDIELLTL